MKLSFVSLNQNRGDTYPMGLLALMSYLNSIKDLSFDMVLIDANFEKNILQKIIESKPDIIGISAMTIEYSGAIKLAKQLKKQLNVPIILGGVHISTLPTSLHPSFDLGVIGEGEETILELLQIYSKKKEFLIADLKSVKGIVFHNLGQKIINGSRGFFELDSFPIWDRTLLNPEYFKPKRMHTGKSGICETIMTSRGCPYNCRFCSTKSFWKKVRFHSPHRVVDEIKYLYGLHKLDHIIIWDDLFSIDRVRIKEIICLLDEENLLGKISFSCNLRANLVDENLCSLLKELNVVYVGFGFESGSNKILQWLKKNNSLTVQQNRKAAKLCKDFGFIVEGSLIFGSPGETIGDMKKTLNLIDYFIKIKLDNVWSFTLTPFPATEAWEIAKKRNKVNDYEMDWDILSLHNINEPLLLDESITKDQFMDIFLESRRKLKYFKWQKIKKDFINGNILHMIKNTLKNPKLLTNLIFKKHTVAENK